MQNIYMMWNPVMTVELKGKGENLLKQHHHVRLDKEFKDDCRVWLPFLQNKMIAVSRPFVDLQTTLNAEVLDWYTDATKGKLLGFGGVHG